MDFIYPSIILVFDLKVNPEPSIQIYSTIQKVLVTESSIGVWLKLHSLLNTYC